MKYLSFAVKIRLVSSIIYGKVNFKSSVYTLPKSFYAILTLFVPRFYGVINPFHLEVQELLGRISACQRRGEI